MWTIPPATTLSPMPVTASAGSTPAFCMKRTLSAMPPTLAGVTRLTNDDASCASTVGTNGRCSATLPRRPNAAATYVSPDSAMHASDPTELAERRAWKLSSTLASCGRRT